MKKMIIVMLMLMMLMSCANTGTLGVYGGIGF